jgi:hypothetical protein
MSPDLSARTQCRFFLPIDPSSAFSTSVFLSPDWYCKELSLQPFLAPSYFLTQLLSEYINKKKRSTLSYGYVVTLELRFRGY